MPLPGTRTSVTTGRTVTIDDAPEVDNSARAAPMTTTVFMTHHHTVARGEYARVRRSGHVVGPIPHNALVQNPGSQPSRKTVAGLVRAALLAGIAPATSPT